MTKTVLAFSCWALLAGGLAACTVGPDYKAPTPDLPADWSENATARQQATAEDLRQWWQGFADADLDRLIHAAIDGNPDLKIAAERIRAARADRVVVAAAGEPSVGFQASAQRSRASKALTLMPGVGGIANDFMVGFDASWEIDLFGKTRRAVEAADASVDASIEDRRATLVTLLGEVVSDYAALRSAQERAAIAKRTIEADRDALDLARERFLHGLGNELDVAQASAELEQVEAGLPQFETDAAQAAHALAILLGRTPGALADLLASPRDLPALPTPGLLIPSEVLRNRPDIRAAERRLAAANAEIGVAIANQFPSFTLSPSLGVEAGKLSKLLTGDGLIWGVSAGVSQSIYDGGALAAQVDKARALTEEERLSYQKTVLAALGEVEDQIVALANERRRHDRLAAAVEANRTALARSRSLYQSGLASFINVVNSERNLNSAEDSLAQSRVNLMRQTVALYKALGGGWQGADAELAASAASRG